MKLWRYCQILVFPSTLNIFRSYKVYVLGNDNIEDRVVLNHSTDFQGKCVISPGIIKENFPKEKLLLRVNLYYGQCIS